MKKLLLIALIFIGLGAGAQNPPTIESYSFDTLCIEDYEELFLTITIKDLDGDSTYIESVIDNGSSFDQGVFIIENPVVVPGDTLRTVQIKATPNWGLPVGLNLGSINLDIVGNVGVDGAGAILNSDINDIPIYHHEAPLTTGTLTVCSNDNPLDLDQYSSEAGGEWHWEGGIGVYNDNSIFDPEVAMPVYDYNGGEYSVSYYHYNSAGCEYYEDIFLNYNDAPYATITPTPSTCQNADGAAVANIAGGLAPYNVYWTTGLTEQVSTTSTISNLSSGNYYINIEDQNGCKSVAVANIGDSDISVTPNITASNCVGQNGTIDLSINPQQGVVSDIFWSNGNTTSSIAAGSGDYTVEIHTDANCNFYGTYTIPNNHLKVDLVDYYDNGNCLTTPDGSIDITTSGGTAPYTWAWDKNGTSFSTMEDLNGIGGGVYECTVMDDNGCSLSWDINIDNYSSNVYAWVDNVTKVSCGGMNGAIDIALDTIWGEVPTVYQWSTGATTEDLTGLAAGTYTLTYTDAAGCENNLAVKVPYKQPYQPQICLLTVDTSFTYNQVVWEKISGQNIEGFNVYRETSQFGVFEKVADRPYSLDSEFMDNAASPIDRSWRYYITTYDGCGNESNPSFIHKTIHTVANDGGGGSFDVSWDKYEGIDYTSADLYRRTATTPWTNIGNFGLTELTYNDTPPEVAGLDYIVSFNLAQTCTSSKAQDYNSSRSNNSSAIFDPGESTLLIQDKEFGEIRMYPNPTTDILNIYIEMPEQFEMIEIRDANGKLILLETNFNATSTFDMSDYTNGVYFVRLISGEQAINHKIIKG